MYQRSLWIRRFCSNKQPAADLRLYDGRTKEKVGLRGGQKPYLSFYTCGPTVYDSAHIGHASCYVRLDILQRILRHHFQLPLVTAMNVTDIDDKIIVRAQESGTGWKELAHRYEAEFWTDLRRLNVRPPDVKLRVTDHIPAIMRFVQTLIDKGYAYRADDGSVYFETGKYKRYGKLQKVILEPSATAATTDGSHKRHPSDFALWKASKPNEPMWEAGFSNGRPGWHIECSTMASHIFGQRLDFHAGGLDLRFPHHENEETQSCCYHGVQDWVTHWLHTGQLHLAGQTHKMSKSLKNTISIAELLGAHSADEFRMLCLLSHYRSAIEYGPETMSTASNVWRKFVTFFHDSKAYVDGRKPATYSAAPESALFDSLLHVQANINKHLANDFNTASSLLALADLVSTVQRTMNTNERDACESHLIGASNVGAVLAATRYIREQLHAFGLQTIENSPDSTALVAGKPAQSRALVEEMVKIRSEIRQRAAETKDAQLYRVCDQLRDGLRTAGVEVKDHGKETSWSWS
ncbi:probable cysteine--tRNA ligase, mitochondrial [Anopheles cruzii]|uniref:probable cysteine--tRNA ligase, mitochondrial n=1 Tax=Anopheles cruzii TaxID=68878 RepID=UPI0022EC8B8C|nr:probable cysteine--tRNA ligase, mitochondrial [Anopheles cruzii]